MGRLRLHVVSIAAGEDVKAAIAKIKRETQWGSWSAWEPPANLAGNFKVLTLRSGINIDHVCKVDGPGFIIDALYAHYLKR